MPYIKQDERPQYDHHIEPLVRALEENDFNEGHINYIFCKILKAKYDKENHSYKSINAIMGVLDCVGIELYRRFFSIKEEIVRVKNGDI